MVCVRCGTDDDLLLVELVVLDERDCEGVTFEGEICPVCGLEVVGEMQGNNQGGAASREV